MTNGITAIETDAEISIDELGGSCGDHSLGAEISKRFIFSRLYEGNRQYVSITPTYYIAAEINGEELTWNQWDNARNAGVPLTYTPKIMIELIEHTDREDAGGSEVFNDYHYEDTGAFHSTLEEALADATERLQRFTEAQALELAEGFVG